MPLRRQGMVAVLLAVGLALSACAETAESEASGTGPATLVEVEGTDVQQVVLTKKAATRLDIQMTAVTGGEGATVIPYASVVYDAEGATWAYTSPEPLTFVRTPITVASIAGDQARLSAGPDSGTEVVTVGTAELYGAEQGIGQ